jgi:hypothetical protein
MEALPALVVDVFGRGRDSVEHVSSLRWCLWIGTVDRDAGMTGSGTNSSRPDRRSARRRISAVTATRRRGAPHSCLMMRLR